MKKTLLLLTKLYALAIAVFFIFRLLLFIVNLDKLSSDSISDILYAFVNGLRFDLVIIGYILALPALVLLILPAFKLQAKLALQIIKWFIVIIFAFAFSVCGIDIPYFNQFFARFTVEGMVWFWESPIFVMQMAAQEITYWIYTIPVLLFIYLFYKLINRIFANYSKSKTTIKKPIPYILGSILILGFIFLGVRGRIAQKSPIRIGTAYFSDDELLNKLGLNPNFTLIRSYLNSIDKRNKSIHLLPNDVAMKNLRQYLGLDTLHTNTISRKIAGDSAKQIKPNIIIVIMESMSAQKMAHFGNTQNLTPFLDSLYHKGMAFNNFYSAGIHTYNGIFCTLFSIPTVFHKHPMNNVSMKQYQSIPFELKKHNYNTVFYTTHDGQFDNVAGFLKGNYFDRIYSQADYPSEKVLSTLGVPDDYMFEYAIPNINKLANDTVPFLTAFMTSSDHGPRVLPEYYNPRTENIKTQMVEYADWALSKFMQMASEQEWFNNTMFVFVGDHGYIVDPIYSMPLSFNHVPMLIYAPSIIEKDTVIDNFGGQIDILPTIMGVTQMPYTNNTFGIDLLNSKRPAMYFCDNTGLGVINDSLYLILKNEETYLYKYRSGDKHNYINEFKTEAADLEKYGKSHIQAAEFFMTK